MSESPFDDDRDGKRPDDADDPQAPEEGRDGEVDNADKTQAASPVGLEAAAERMRARATSLAEAIRTLSDRHDYAGMVDMIETLPPTVRVPAVECELARAYSNLGITEKNRERFEKALRVLDAIPAFYHGKFHWLFRRGVALMHLERGVEAAVTLAGALARDPENKDAERYMEWAMQFILGQPFSYPFTARAQQVWARFAKEAEKIARDLKTEATTPAWASRRVRDILDPALTNRCSVEIHRDPLTPEGLRLTISPSGWRLTAFLTEELVRRAPELPGWRITSAIEGLAPGENPAAYERRVEGRELRPDNIWVRLGERDGAADLGFWSEELQGMRFAGGEERRVVFDALEWLLKHVVGEAAQMRWLARFTMEETAPEGAVRLAEFPKVFLRQVPDYASLTLADYLALETSSEEEPYRRPHAEFLLDNIRFTTACPPLHNAYARWDPSAMEEIERAGVTAGVLMVTIPPAEEKEGTDGEAKTQERTEEQTEERRAEEIALRAAARRELDAFIATVPSGIFRRTGHGSALSNEYVEGIVWNSVAFFNLVEAWVREADLAGFAGVRWHTFMRGIGGVDFRKSDDERQHRTVMDAMEALRRDGVFGEGVRAGAAQEELRAPFDEAELVADAEDAMMEAAPKEEGVRQDDAQDASAQPSKEEASKETSAKSAEWSSGRKPSSAARAVAKMAALAFARRERNDEVRRARQRELQEHFQAFLKKIGWRFDYDPKTNLLHTGVALSGVMERSRIAVIIEPDFIQTYAFAKDLVPEERRAAMAEFVTRVNLGLKRGCFEFDMDVGILRYHMYADVPFEGSLPPDSVMRTLLFLPPGMLEQYGNGFVDVLQGRKSVAQAVEDAEAEVGASEEGGEDRDEDGFPVGIATAEA